MSLKFPAVDRVRAVAHEIRQRASARADTDYSIAEYASMVADRLGCDESYARDVLSRPPKRKHPNPRKFPPAAEIRAAVAEHGGDQAAAARALGCGPAAVRDVMQRAARGPSSGRGRPWTWYLPDDLRAGLEAAAEREGLSMSALAAKALREYLTPPCEVRSGGIMPKIVVDPAVDPAPPAFGLAAAARPAAKPDTAARPGETFDAWLARTQHRP